MKNLNAENARLRAERDIYKRALIDIDVQFRRHTDVEDVIDPAWVKANALTSPCPGFEIEDGSGEYTGCDAASTGATDCPVCRPKGAR